MEINIKSYISSALIISTVFFSGYFSKNSTEQNSVDIKGRYKVSSYQFDDGSWSIETTKIIYDRSEVDLETFRKGKSYQGLYYKQRTDCSGLYGYEKTIKLPLDSRVTGDLKKNPLYTIKTGDWYYFDERGMVDSIINYGDFKKLTCIVDTGYDTEDENIIYYIDSIVKVSYESKEVKYKK
jgi:hypothetical protein